MAIVGKAPAPVRRRARAVPPPADALGALHSLDPGCLRDEWAVIGMAAKDAGLGVDHFIAWSKGASNYRGEQDCRTAWASFKAGKVTAATLFAKAREAGWRGRINGHAGPQERPPEARSGALEASAGGGARVHDIEAVWNAAEPATAKHRYLARKKGRPDGLRVVPAGSSLMVARRSVAGWLAVPLYDGGELATLQFIGPDGDKLTAPGPMRGWFTVGAKPAPGDDVYVTEGLATGWSCHRATRHPAAVAFGLSRMRTVAEQLIAEGMRPILVSDAGVEDHVESVASGLSCRWVSMPEESPKGFDANDCHVEHGLRALKKLLAEPREPEPVEDRYPGLRIVVPTYAQITAAELTPRELLPFVMYADVRLRAAAGGTGKTTMVLWEAATLALRKPLYGSVPARPVKTILISREDPQKPLWARLREICRAMKLARTEIETVFSRVVIVDLSEDSWRLSRVVNDVVEPDYEAIEALIDRLASHKPDWIVFDPAISFGVGESRVNDSEQGLIEACRIIRNRLDCCAEIIHHTGKENARAGARDQYSFRGGSALSDGARMVVIVNVLEAGPWNKETGLALGAEESGLVVTLAKLSYARRPDESIYLIRRGFTFERVFPEIKTPEQRRDADAEKVLEFLRNEARESRRYSSKTLENSREVLGLTQLRIRTALDLLLSSSRVTRVKGTGNSQWLEPAEGAAPGSEAGPEPRVVKY